MPLITDRLRESVPWAQLAIESVLVVISVLMALGLDAWYDHTQEQEKVRRALRTIHAELVEVRDPMAQRASYHAAIVDTFRTDSLSFQQPLALRYVDPAKDGWAVAQQTGAVAFMDFEVVTSVSRAYSQGEDLEFLIRKSYDLLFDGIQYRGMTPNQIGDFGGYLSDVVGTEREYVRRVDRAITAIEAHYPSLARTDTAAASADSSANVP